MDPKEVVNTRSRLSNALKTLQARYDQHRKGGHERQTCILNSIEFLCQRIITLRDTAKVTAKHIYVVYLSDMLEDCAATPARHPIIMTKHDNDFTDKEPLLAGILEQPQCLKNTRIFVVLPGEINEAAYPSLTSFWRAAFKRFGIDDHDFRLWRNQLPPELAPLTR